MKHPVSKVTIEQINRILKRDFPSTFQKAMEILNQYSNGEKYRVWASLVKLSERDLIKLKENTNLAIRDYRDVLAYAEYPEYTATVGFNSEKFTQKEINEIIKRDYKQYSEWLEK